VTLTEDVRSLIADTIAIADERHAEMLRELEGRLDEPLRLAIAGRVKAGKSTLLNALVGEAVAPTDAAECTKVVTWYVNGLTYRAWLHPVSGAGEARQVPFSREPGNAHIDIGETDLDKIEHLRVEFPSQYLDGIDLIDTPGTASISESVSERSLDFLLEPDHSEVDIVVYLMRHLHDRDVDFLEAFVGEADRIRPTMAVGVLSRADEIGGGRSDAMEIARQAAEASADDPRLRDRVQTVIPVAGLLAFTAATLREEEFQQLRRIALRPIEEIDVALASVDAFIEGSTISDATVAERRSLVERLGLHGIRFSVGSIIHGTTTSASELARGLEAHSGLDELRLLVRGLYAERRAVLKADLALNLIEEVARAAPRDAARPIDAGVERIRATTHELGELDALYRLRVDPPADLAVDLRRQAERLLGAAGADTRARLDLDLNHSDEELRAYALELLSGWRSIADRPLVSRELRMLVPTVEITLERLYSELATA